MSKALTLLVADRNRNVRELLRREFLSEGYRVLIARDAREVLALLESAEPPDLLVLDPEISCTDGLPILERLQDMPGDVPVVVHAFPAEITIPPRARQEVILVEKSEDIDRLKSAIRDVLAAFYAHRTSAGPKEALPEKKPGDGPAPS